MKKIIFIIFCVAFTSVLWGQDAQPQWIESRSRAFLYPTETHITGFAQGNQRAGETLADAIVRIKQDAKGELAGSIRSSVKSQTQQSTRQDANYNVSSTFNSATSTASDADIADVKIEHYVSKTDKIIYGFAYIKRQDLISYYQNQIALHLNTVEGALKTAEALQNQGEKAKAGAQCQKLAQMMDKVRYAQELLAAVDKGVSDFGLQQQRSKELDGKMATLCSALENSNFVFLKCPEEMSSVAEQVAGLLSAGDCGCNFTDNEQEADLVISILPVVKRCTEEEKSKQVFCYAAATGSVLNTRSNKTLKWQIDEVKGAWTNSDFDKAEDVAKTALAKEIAKKLMTYFKN